MLYAHFRLHPYLSHVKEYTLRSALTRQRVSAHRLEVETGIWHKPRAIPYLHRKCIACNKLEDVFHFMLECSLNKEIRKRFLKNTFRNIQIYQKLFSFFTSDNKELNINIAMFVQKSFELRNLCYCYYN